MHKEFYLLVIYIATVSNIVAFSLQRLSLTETKTVTKIITKKSNNCHYN